MNQDHKSKTVFFITLFLILFFIAAMNRKKHFDDQETLMFNNKVSLGKITYLGGIGGRSASPPEYTFYIDNKKIVSKFYSDIFCIKKSELSARDIMKIQFPVIHDKDNPRVNKMLIKVEDYHKYNIPIPDSLAEVLVYYFNCDYKVVRPEGKPAQIIKK